MTTKRVKKGKGSATIHRIGAFLGEAAANLQISVRSEETGEPVVSKFWTKNAFGGNGAYLAEGSDVTIPLSIKGIGHKSLRMWRSREHNLVVTINTGPATGQVPW